ncbi:MAG: DbpA RNA binding domain-containing protein, partial [Myxococcales bacterium]|nr:DbpA RNA binding domain-containing protein [Myxococcales bacterium]
ERRGGPSMAMDRYRMEVGSSHGVEPRHIVGAIAGETGLRGKDIGKVELHAEHSFVELPPGMPTPILKKLQRAWVAERQLRIKKASG